MKKIIDWFLNQKRIVKALILTVAYFVGLGLFVLLLILGGLVGGNLGAGIMGACIAVVLAVIVNYYCLDD